MSAAPVDSVAETCQHCHAPVGPADVFCEACGETLPGRSGSPAEASAAESTRVVSAGAGAVSAGAAPAVGLHGCVSCGGPGISADGYCEACGTKQPNPRDHQELKLNGAFAVTDRGRHHARNEDAMGLAVRADGTVVAVVCDGVSMTVKPDEAAAAAVEASMAVLADADLAGRGAIDEALVEAHTQARTAVQEIEFVPDAELGAPSCTFLAAIVTSRSVTVGCLGDCRAYLIDPAAGTETILTADDSWAASEVAQGAMTSAEAFGDARSHMITRWIGVDADPSWAPTISSADDARGRLLLCSDGLWNYAAQPGEMISAVGWRGDDLGAIGRQLVRFANAAGGHDNITAILVDV